MRFLWFCVSRRKNNALCLKVTVTAVTKVGKRDFELLRFSTVKESRLHTIDARFHNIAYFIATKPRSQKEPINAIADLLKILA